MRNLSLVAALAVSVGFATFGPAFANGGMGDPSAFTKANNERCEAQRRGEYPSTFNACLPDYPVTDYGSAPSNGRHMGGGGMN